MINEKNRKIFSWHQAATWFFLLLVAGFFLFSKESLAYTGDYNKPVNGTLSASEWNNLINDFIAIRASGNVGIGTTTPAYKLTVMGAASIGNTLFFNLGSSYNGNYIFYGDQGADYGFTFNVNGTNRGFIGNSYSYFINNIGIGTTTPSSKLTFPVDTAKLIDLGGGRIGNVSDPVALQDAATRAFVESTINSSAFWLATSTGIFYNGGNVGIGTNNPTSKLTVSADILVNGLIIGKSGGNKNNNIAFGANALALNTTGDWSTAIGGGALGKNTTGSTNTAVGGGALFENTIGQWNAAVGTSAMAKNTDGSYNTAVGPSTLWSNTSGTSSTAIGVSALYYNTLGSSNIAVGRSALFNNTSGSNNLGLGNSSLGGNLIGNNNVAIGHQAARYISGTTSYTSANNSVYIGALTKPFADSMTNEIVIGYDAKGVGSNSAVIGSSSILTTILNGKIGIGTTIPSSKLTLLGGDFEMENNKSIAVNLAGSNATILFGNYGDGEGFSYGTSTSATNKTLSLAVEGDVKARRFCIGEDCKDTWQEIVYAGGGGNSVYVGSTAKVTGNNNNVPGYKEAARLCDEVVDGSHVCTPDDMLNTITLNSLMPTENVWVFTGPPGYTAVANDCDGRSTNSNSSALGAYWEVTNPSFPNGGRGLTSPCGANLKLACCK